MSQGVLRVELKRADALELLAQDEVLRVAPVGRALLSSPELLQRGVLRRHLPGGVLWQPGDEGQSLLVVLSGLVRLYGRRDADLTEVDVAGKGDVLGENEVLSGQLRRSCAAVTPEGAEVLELPREALLVHIG